MIHYDSIIMNNSNGKFVVVFILLYGLISGIFSLFSQAVQLFITPAVILLVTSLFILLFVEIYFRSNRFKEIKKSLEIHINECNELNEYILKLKDGKIWRGPQFIGQAFLSDISRNNFQRTHWSQINNVNDTINCSLSICRNAKSDPIKYISKYFNIIPTEENLVHFENILNKFESAETGRKLLVEQQHKLISGISSKIPQFIFKFWNKRLKDELGFSFVEMKDIHFQTFTFQYVSSGGNSSAKCVVILDIENLNNLVIYLNDRIRFRKSIKGQRALMTSYLRLQIKERDNFTCKICRNSVSIEPNLLLEIDHIVPVSKGGLSSLDNLQTLCWRCNRSKGSKMI